MATRSQATRPHNDLPDDIRTHMHYGVIFQCFLCGDDVRQELLPSTIANGGIRYCESGQIISSSVISMPTY